MPETKAGGLGRNLAGRVGATHLHIARNMLLVGLFVGVGKLAGAAKEMLVAYRYGVSGVVDGYLLVFTLVMWLPTVWNSVAGSVFVPLTHRLPDAERTRFNGELLGALLLVGGALSALLLLASPGLASLATERLSLTAAARPGLLIATMAPMLLVGLVVAQCNAQLLAEQRHANTLLGALPALVLMGVLALWPGRFDVVPLILGTVLGQGVQLAVLLALTSRSPHVSAPRRTRDSAGWPGFRDALGIMIVSQTVISTVTIIDQLIASGLGVGGVATLGYATRFLSLFIGLGAIAVGRAILPVLSSDESAGTRSRIALRWFFGLFALGLAAVPVLWLLVPTGVRLLFERGAFDAGDTLVVSRTIRFGLAQVPFYFASIVLVQLFASGRAYRVLLGSSLIAVALKLASGFAFAGIWGVPGIALSTGVMYAGTFAWLAVRAARWDGEPDPGRGPGTGPRSGPRSGPRA